MAVSPAINAITRQACAAAAGTSLQVNIPRGAVVALLRPITAAGQVAHTGTDATAIGAAYGTLDAGAWTPWPCAGLAALYLAHTNNDGVIEILFPTPGVP